MEASIKTAGITFSLSVFLGLTSCSTFSLNRHIPTPTGTFLKTIPQSGYTVEVDAIDSNGSKELFGVDLTKIGVQTFNVGIDNQSSHPIAYDAGNTVLQDKGHYAHQPLSTTALAKMIYDSDRFKYMARQGARDGLIFGVLGAAAGAAIGAVFGVPIGNTNAIGPSFVPIARRNWSRASPLGSCTGIGPFSEPTDRTGAPTGGSIIGGAWGGSYAGGDAPSESFFVAGAAIGAAVGATAGAVKGALEAEEKVTKKIARDLLKVSLRPEAIAPGIKKSGLLFFQVAGKELKHLRISLSREQPERRKERLELELEVAPEPLFPVPLPGAK